MICSSLYLLVFMSVILHKLTDFSTFNWYGLWGAGHVPGSLLVFPGLLPHHVPATPGRRVVAAMNFIKVPKPLRA
jgi:hypothetical protein